MLANTADTGALEYNTADGTLSFLHAVERHVARPGDVDLAVELAPRLQDVVDSHRAGTRFGIRVDRADGVALTWMDARINGLAAVAGLLRQVGRDDADVRAPEGRARSGFRAAYLHDGRCHDLIGDLRLRPNQLLAVSLPHAPLDERSVVEACSPLVTSLGLRSLGPAHPEHLGRHRGDPFARDSAYHQGAVWPWLIGPYVEAASRTGVSVDGIIDGLAAHLGEWRVGSVSETVDGDPPHAATGCPFQAWSVVELLRAWRLVTQGAPAPA